MKKLIMITSVALTLTLVAGCMAEANDVVSA